MIKLERKYQDLGFEKKIKGALNAWKNFLANGSNRNKMDVFLKSKNSRIRIFAILESLPTLVMHQMLWYYNIDFMSKESFLTRLSQKDFQNIENTFDDLYKNKVVPECCKKGFKNKLKQFLGILPKKFEDIFDSGFDDYRGYNRYTAKGKTAFEFFGSDFGFNKFLSTKNDEVIGPAVGLKEPTLSGMANYMTGDLPKSDFIVNRMSGLYNWMYILSRTNVCFWNEGKKIISRSHPCSEIWGTWSLWFLAIIFSPLLLISGYSRIFYNSIISREGRIFFEKFGEVMGGVLLFSFWAGISLLSYFLFFENIYVTLLFSLFLLLWGGYEISNNMFPCKFRYIVVPVLLTVIYYMFIHAWPYIVEYGPVIVQLISSVLVGLYELIIDTSIFIYNFVIDNKEIFISIVSSLVLASVAFKLLDYILEKMSKKENYMVYNNSKGNLVLNFVSHMILPVTLVSFFGYMVYSLGFAIFLILVIPVTVTILIYLFFLFVGHMPHRVFFEKKYPLVSLKSNIYSFRESLLKNKFFDLKDSGTVENLRLMFKHADLDLYWYISEALLRVEDKSDFDELKKILLRNSGSFARNKLVEFKQVETVAQVNIQKLEKKDENVMDIKSNIEKFFISVKNIFFGFFKSIGMAIISIYGLVKSIFTFFGMIRLWRKITSLQCPGAIDRLIS